AGAHGLPLLFGASPRKPGSRNREHGCCGSVLIHVFQVLRQSPTRKSACCSERAAPVAATSGASTAATTSAAPPRGGLISRVRLRSEMMMNIDSAGSAFAVLRSSLKSWKKSKRAGGGQRSHKVSSRWVHSRGSYCRGPFESRTLQCVVRPFPFWAY